MRRSTAKLRTILGSERGDLALFTCFFIVGIIAILSLVLLFASVQINLINIRNGAKMELNNLSATIFADTYRSQRESNSEQYLRTLYSSTAYTSQLEETVRTGLASKINLSTPDYRLRNIRLDFTVVGSGIEYVFICDADFYINMFGSRLNILTRQIRLTGYHNTKF